MQLVEILDNIGNSRAFLRGRSALIERVKKQRDRVIAHLDRKHINNLDAIVSDQVDMTEVGQCFEGLLQTVNTYKAYYDAGEFSLKPIERGVQGDVDYLITLMEKAYE